jgi:hypothetical protein
LVIDEALSTRDRLDHGTHRGLGDARARKRLAHRLRERMRERCGKPQRKGG